MSRPRSFLSSRTSILYLLEPVLAFIAIILLVALFQPTQPEPPVRVMELHAQDIASLIQLSRQKEAAEWLEGKDGLETTVSIFASELNPSYGYTLELSDGTGSRKAEKGKGLTGMTVERLVIHKGTAMSMKLTLWL